MAHEDLISNTELADNTSTFKLHKDEHVLLTIRRHWIFIFIDAKICLLYFLVPTIFIWALQHYNFIPDIVLFGVSIYAASDILIYLWALFCWMLYADKFTDYVIDVWIVTNKRIIESELTKLFDRKLSTLELQDIEDISIESGGFFANLIGWGTLEVQTAGTKREFLAEKIENPVRVQKIIFDAKLADEHEKMNIEKGEFEQISNRVFSERVGESLQKKTENHNFDWANLEARQKSDLRNQEDIEKVDSKFEEGIENALRSDNR